MRTSAVWDGFFGWFGYRFGYAGGCNVCLAHVAPTRRLGAAGTYMPPLPKLLREKRRCISRHARSAQAAMQWDFS